LLRFFDAIESSATHIYDSALPLSPSSSLVRALYVDQISTDVKISGIEDSWDACMRTIRLHKGFKPIGYTTRMPKCMTFYDRIAVADTNVVEIFETATGLRQTTLTTNSSIVEALAFSPNDTILVTRNNDGRVYVWDLRTGGLVDALEGHILEINSVAFSPCGSMIATSSNDRTIRIWNSSSLDCRCILAGHSDVVRTICWSATGTRIISGSDDTTVKVWSISGKCSKTFTVHTHLATAVASSPDSSLIASGSEDRTIKMYDSQTGDVLHTIAIPHLLGYVRSVRFFGEDQIMYTTNTVFVIRNLTERVDILTSEREKSNVAISSDGSCFASSQDFVDVVKIWQADGKKNQDAAGYHHAGKVHCISFTNDGRLVASGSEDKTIKIWDISSGQCLTTFRGHLNIVRMAAFSPDMTLCASGGWNDDIRIWNVHTGNPVSNLGHHSLGSNLCFSPDSSQLASTSWSDDGKQVKLWKVATGDCLALMQVDSKVENISLDVDGNDLVLIINNTERWRLSSAPTPSPESSVSDDTDANISSGSLPMVFVPIHHATQPSMSPCLPPYRHDPKTSWILDQQERRMLWVVPDWQSHFHGTKVVLTSPTGRVIMIVDFRT
jgi:WD40 repeat protein